MTDPIVFSDEKHSLGLIDHGEGGIGTFMKKHVCNEICKKIPMQEDQELIKKIEDFKERFVKNDFAVFEENLKIVLNTLELQNRKWSQKVGKFPPH